MALVLQLLTFVVFVFFLFLLVRLILDWVMFFAREWRPRGAVLVIAEATYTVTDPPLRALRRILPPVTIGPVRLDLAFLVLFIGCSFLLSLLPSIAAQL
ncbi:MAG: YggT family protein [Cellulomonas sp.]|uniref:YggT family protein n=1 Tax=Cellulomonas gelida TaxID=1712 RepID=A0A4Y3KJ67_9CELL|nr:MULTISPECIES: YggT family protein [Cellulomonas]KMM45795.1 membrane protein [Cellulomonas sp. A375-1]MCR6647145.1 YggT family protein [Cellulomonas sp.]MCR6706004.1 YggT family protein [Cellulomonas sp.]GEA83953.1 YggT family protein [Cellulomonas gelida]GGL27451.1 YggT family protein [Cellulomonas gelida]